MLTVVTGPPCSGKSTYVQQHRHPGDLTIDFDSLAKALGSQVSHNHEPWHREVTAAAWAEAVRRATQSHRQHRAWIIDARPREDRLAAYERAGARIIRLDADGDELHRRATAAARPASDHQRIDEWVAMNNYPVRTRHSL